MPRIAGLTAVVLTFAWMIPLQRLDQRMREAVDGGIVAYELCRTVERCASMQAALVDGDQIGATRAILLLDGPFLVLYPTAILFVLRALADAFRHRRGLSTATRIVAWLQPAAGAFDLVENVALWRMLDGVVSPWPGIAFACATAKFFLVAVGLTFVLVLGAGALIAGRRRASPAGE